MCGLQDLDLRWMVNEKVLCDCAVWDWEGRGRYLMK